ncbi:tape measure protein [Agrobacterium tumefaciens]|uniref:tape measure protein n=1 Tax=Agrobacterium tumefaciens TaxID=358 RepID=UPI0015739D6C|nr:tape measure protein [Agrobacterium tumefaciens]
MNKAQGLTNQRARSIENRFKKMNSTIAASYGGLATSAAKAFALIGGVQGFRTLSDSATKIDNALKVAGLSGEELERTYAKLRNSAQANAAPLETLVQLYGRVALVQGELGITSDQLVGFSNNVAMALRVSGQSSQEASGALLQLAQALGSGVVRAEEFNSIVEGAPTILQAAAAGIKEAGGSVSKLRTIMLDGKLSSKAFFDGINAGAPVLEDKLANATLTIDQRLENLRTSLVDAAREFNNSSKAAEVFGTEIDRVAQFVSNINFETLIGEIQKAAGEFNAGTIAAQGFFEQVGKLSGLAGIGDSIVNALGGKDGKVEFLGGALGIQSTISGEEKINDLAERRLSIEKQIAEVKSNPANVLGQAELRQLEAQLAAVNAQSSKLAGSITGGPLDYNRFPPPKSTAAVKPITLADPKYQVTDSKSGKSGGGRGSRENEYQREIEQITKRTDALKAETAAQAGLNPLLNDYGFAVEFARAKQDLLTAAQEAGIKITPELTKSIEGLASGYANAVVASEKLAEKQDEIRQRAEEAMATAKDVTRGMIDGFIEGASAADILADSLKKIGSALLDDVLNSIFKVNNAAGGSGGGFLSSIFGGLFGGGGKGSFPSAPGGLYSDGGYTGDGGKYQPAGVVHKGEYVFDKAAVKAAGGPAAMEAMRRNLKGYANGGPVGISVPSIPSLRPANANAVKVNYAPVIDARGADAAAVARLEKVVAKQGAEMQGRVEAAVRSAQKRNVKLG